MSRPGPCILLIFLTQNFSFANQPIDDLCRGPGSMLNVIDRPSEADSVCTVPYLHVMVESGFEDYHMTNNGGTLRTYPDTEVRFGLKKDSEIYIVLPTYYESTLAPHYGNTGTYAGFKHRLGYNSKWMVTAEAGVVFPDGSYEFGNQDVGGIGNLIFNYSFTSKLGLTAMLGLSTLTDSPASGGYRYNSFNPDFVLSYTIGDRVNVFGEIYGASKTDAGQHSGFNADIGLLFLITQTMVIDINAGQRLSGYPTSYENYCGCGVSFLLG